MSDQGQPEQLRLFETHIDYTLRLTRGTQTGHPSRYWDTKEWPLPAARAYEDGVAAMQGYALFSMFAYGIFWGQGFNDEDAATVHGVDPNGTPVLLELTMQDSYIDSEGNRL